jgi:hypothetical protein
MFFFHAENFFVVLCGLVEIFDVDRDMPYSWFFHGLSSVLIEIVAILRVSSPPIHTLSLKVSTSLGTALHLNLLPKEVVLQIT